MRAKARLTFAAPLAALLLLSWPAGAQSPQPAGEVRAVVPVGHLLRGTAPQRDVHRQDPVYWQDVIRTERAGRVRVGLLDGSILNVGSDSQLQILQHDARGQHTILDLAYGKMRATVVRLVRPGASFRVRTPVVSAGVVGTRFVIRIFADFTEVLCLDGEVRVRNTDEAVAGEVVLLAGQFTRVARGLAPLPAARASPEQVREAEQETDIPGLPDLSRVEVSLPPTGCGPAATLIRVWTKQLQQGREVETPVDAELLTGTLNLGGQTLHVEGGHADLPSTPLGEGPRGRFTPEGTTSATAVKAWPPLHKLEEGQGWRAPRAVFAGSAFYVLGPMAFPGRSAFTFAGHPATLLWEGPCGAGFLAPLLPGKEYPVALSLAGTQVAVGMMNLIQVSYRMPVPPAVARGAEAKFGIDVYGLERLDRFTGGRPVLITTVTNQTPAMIGNLRSRTPGARVVGEAIVYAVGARHFAGGGVARLDGSARGRQAGAFVLGVDHKLDDALQLPRTPLTPLQP